MQHETCRLCGQALPPDHDREWREFVNRVFPQPFLYPPGYSMLTDLLNVQYRMTKSPDEKKRIEEGYQAWREGRKPPPHLKGEG